MKKLIIILSLIIVSACCKLDQNITVDVYYDTNITNVIVTTKRPTVVELNLQSFKDTVFCNKLPIHRSYSGNLTVTYREINNILN